MVFMYQTNWFFPMPIYEIFKVVIELILFIAIILIFIKYKKIMVNDYVEEWNAVKEKERK